MFSSIKAATLAVIAIAAGKALAESHTITFANNCRYGTPTLIGEGGVVLSTGGAYTVNGPLLGAIAYLQTGGCGFNGEGCTLVETTLKNPSTDGSGSSTDISLIPPHTFSVTSGFGYVGPCSPAGADCNNPNCNTAFHVPTDTYVQVACQEDNANVVLTVQQTVFSMKFSGSTRFLTLVAAALFQIATASVNTTAADECGALGVLEVPAVLPEGVDPTNIRTCAGHPLEVNGTRANHDGFKGLAARSCVTDATFGCTEDNGVGYCWKVCGPVGSGVGRLAMGVMVVGIRASLRKIAALTITSSAAVLADATAVAAVARRLLEPQSSHLTQY
ncbi:hypothetical protein B0H12DRAFT_1324948 [Mycena haematopus]|nr:hypothetical protein B0H12DRAFT_1324948 [Mycena haematopus]